MTIVSLSRDFLACRWFALRGRDFQEPRGIPDGKRFFSACEPRI